MTSQTMEPRKGAPGGRAARFENSISWISPASPSTSNIPSTSKAREYSSSCRRVAAVVNCGAAFPDLTSATNDRPLHVTM